VSPLIRISKCFCPAQRASTLEKKKILYRSETQCSSHSETLFVSESVAAFVIVIAQMLEFWEGF